MHGSEVPVGLCAVVVFFGCAACAQDASAEGKFNQWSDGWDAGGYYYGV